MKNPSLFKLRLAPFFASLLAAGTLVIEPGAEDMIPRTGEVRTLATYPSMRQSANVAAGKYASIDRVVYDLSNPAKPVRLNVLWPAVNRVDGNRLYAMNGQVYEVQADGSALAIDKLPLEFNHWPVVNNLMIRLTDIWDVNIPRQPELKVQLPVDQVEEWVGVWSYVEAGKNRGYVVYNYGETHLMKAFDISAEPQYLGEATLPGSLRGVFRNHVFHTLLPSGVLELWDFSDPTAIERLGRITISPSTFSGANYYFLAERYLWVYLPNSSTWKVLDIQNPVPRPAWRALSRIWAKPWLSMAACLSRPT